MLLQRFNRTMLYAVNDPLANLFRRHIRRVNESTTFLSSSFNSAGMNGFGALACLGQIMHYMNAPLVPPVAREPTFAQAHTVGDDARPAGETFTVDADILRAAEQNKGRNVTWRSVIGNQKLNSLIYDIRKWFRNHNPFAKSYKHAYDVFLEGQRTGTNVDVAITFSTPNAAAERLHPGVCNPPDIRPEANENDVAVLQPDGVPESDFRQFWYVVWAITLYADVRHT